MWDKKDKYTFEDFAKIIKILRSPDGCPWDREQTHRSIRNEFIEETYEAVDAIDRGDDTDMCEELGDVMLQVMLHAQIASEENAYDISDVIDGIARKMILRHPHVFGDVKADTTEQVLENWDKIKREEKHQQSYTDTLTSVPMSYPALMRAQKVQKRAKKVGFDWDDIKEPLAKVSEEHKELCEAIESGQSDAILEEFGDMLFALVNVSRFLKIDSEEALQKATDKFITRFARVEEIASENGMDMKETPLEILDKFWDEAKK